MKKFCLIDRPSIIPFYSVMESSELTGELEIVSDNEVWFTPKTVHDEELLLQMICEYSIFMTMDDYLRQRIDLFTLSTCYYDEYLEKLIENETFNHILSIELIQMLEEQANNKEYVLKLFPLRTFQTRELVYEIDKWFVGGKESKEEKQLPKEDEINDVHDFVEISLELSDETVYLEIGESTEEQSFPLDFILMMNGAELGNFPILDQYSDLTELDVYRYRLVLTLFEIFVISKVHVNKKDEVFFKRLFDEFIHPYFLEEIEIVWHDA